MATVKWLALAALAGCGDLQGFGGPAPPLATFTFEVTGSFAPGDDAPNLQVALVYAQQWLTEPLCYLPPPSPDVEQVVATGCRDTFGFVPDRVATSVPAEPNVPGTLSLVELPSADVMVGDVTARVAYASLVAYDDRDGTGTLELDRPHRLPTGGEDGEDDYTATHDIVFGTSFLSMTAPDQRIAFREGAFNQGAAFYPRAGCGDPLPAFSVVAAGGFSAADAIAATLRGELPKEDPATCSELAPETATITIPLRPAGEAREVGCEERNSDSSVRYRQPPVDDPHLADHVFACTSIPDFGEGNADGIVQLVVSNASMDRCQGLTHYVLSGCREDPLCALPDWDYRMTPPAWWPCPPNSAR